jgi:hypothetical protein
MLAVTGITVLSRASIGVSAIFAAYVRTPYAQRRAAVRRVMRS